MFLLRGQFAIGFLTVFLGVRQGPFHVQKPFNVHICECYCHCYITEKCSSFLYVRSDRACYTDDLPCTPATSQRDWWAFNMSKVDDIKYMVVRQTCQEHCDILVGMSKKYACLGRSGKKNEVLSPMLQKESDRNKSNGDLKISHCKYLHKTCRDGLLCRVYFIVSQKLADINCRGHKGNTPVLTAAQHGHVKKFTLLVAMGANVHLVDRYNNTILHVACRSGHREIVRHIISKGLADLESRGYRGWTPVLTAALYDHRDVVSLLGRAGCNFRARDETKKNILHLTCVKGHIDIVRYILARGIPNIDSTCQSGWTAAMLAAKYGNYEVVRLLRSKGCNMRAVTNNRDNILHKACKYGHVKIVKFILNKGIPGIESRGQLQRTPVLTAARNGKVDVVRLLDVMGCNMRVLDQRGNNILHLACFGGNADVVRYLLTRKIVNRRGKNRSGKTPLQIAKSEKHVPIISLFHTDT